jgi:ABC-2 type transport system ATP-binding protein
MQMPVIEVRNLVKEFKQLKYKAGLRGTFMSLFNKKCEVKRAVDDITFSVNPGELIGYIGPNGAGKSTTIKMLTGILVPTSGEVVVDGIVPHESRKANAKKIGVVFGQRSQLWWDLPVSETYNLFKYIYKIDGAVYEKRIKLLKDLLGLDEFWGKPVRQLSLGQRMRGELAAALVHSPSILYLDEPTIGMDALVKERIRQFLTDINRQDGTTIMLTTHDLDEVERLCSRIIVINSGKLLYDGKLDYLRAHCDADSTLVVDFADAPDSASLKDLHITERDGNRYSFSFSRQNQSSSQLIAQIMEGNNVKDIAIKEPSIDTVIKHLYENRTAEPAGEAP